MYDLALKNGFIVNENEIYLGNIYIQDEKIVEISLADKPATEVYDVSGKYLLPAVLIRIVIFVTLELLLRKILQLAHKLLLPVV